MNWCYATASVIGLSHIRTGTRLQDAKCCFIHDCPDQNGQFFFAVIADGAGSAQFGGQGASIVCRTMASQARHAFHTTGSLPDNEAIRSWLELARDRIRDAAEKRERMPRDFAATLVLVMASPNEVVTAHIGDGAIVARKKENAEWVLLSEPHNGQYASTTYFVTDNPQPALRINRCLNQYNSLVPFSDGIENLVLDSATGTPATTFFNPIVKPLDVSTTRGKDISLSKSLADFLASDRMNERTDDDKTLIIAVNK